MNRDDLLKLHDETCAKTRAIMVAKNNDYSGGTHAPDALANFKSAHALELHPVTGLLLRMQDKMMRVKSFVADGALKVSGETVEDAFDDMVNYAILGKALLREERLLRCAPVAPLPVTSAGTQFDDGECSCGRRRIMHYSRGWGCEDCDF